MALPVPQSYLSVQEFAADSIGAIPPCFIQEDHQQFSPCGNDVSSFQEVPIIDMEQLLSGDAKYVELEKLHAACKDWGIFQVVNHGVSSSLVDKLDQETEAFFKLPLEEKAKYRVRPPDVEGYGATIRQQGQKLDWGDRFFVITNPTHRRKPYLIPQLYSSMRETLESYTSELQKLAMQLLKSFSKGLMADTTEMEELFDDGMQAVRMTYYPPCKQPELVLGFAPHSDGSAITILHQLNGVEGLQIKKDGVWMPVHFLPDAFIVITGDILEILSNGVYKSIEHKVNVNSEKERISIAMFFNTNYKAEIGPMQSLINHQNPPLFKTVQMEHYVKNFFSRQLKGKSNLEYMRISTNSTT